MNPQIKERFLELKLVGQRVTVSPEEKRARDFELIAYLESMIANHEVTDFEDIGFCYWNVADNYALLRDGHAFHFFAEFCAHRAALYQNPLLPPKKECTVYAKDNFEAFLDRAKNTSEYPFYRLMYLTLMAKCFPTDSREIKELSEQMLPDLINIDEPRDFLVGEWKSFITPFGRRKCAVVGIASAVNSLIDTGERTSAKELYHTACEEGLPKNAYIEKRIG